jgi:hypothetical protein
MMYEVNQPNSILGKLSISVIGFVTKKIEAYIICKGMMSAQKVEEWKAQNGDNPQKLAELLKKLAAPFSLVWSKDEVLTICKELKDLGFETLKIEGSDTPEDAALPEEDKMLLSLGFKQLNRNAGGMRFVYQKSL